MRLVALGLAVLSTLGACTGATPLPPAATSPPPREAGTIAVTALLDLSGGRAPKGDAQRNAMQLWVDQQQARGTTPRVRLRVVDLAGSDARLLLELRHAGGSADADAIVIGVPVQLDDVMLAALALVGRPILFTLPITEPAGRGEGARWAFGLAPPPEAIARLAVSALPALTTPAVVVSDESPLAVRERLALQREFERQQRPAPTPIATGRRRRTPRRRTTRSRCSPTPPIARVLTATGCGTRSRAVRSPASPRRIRSPPRDTPAPTSATSRS